MGRRRAPLAPQPPTPSGPFQSCSNSSRNVYSARTRWALDGDDRVAGAGCYQHKRHRGGVKKRLRSTHAKGEVRGVHERTDHRRQRHAGRELPIIFRPAATVPFFCCNQAAELPKTLASVRCRPTVACRARTATQSGRSCRRIAAPRCGSRLLRPAKT